MKILLFLFSFLLFYSPLLAQTAPLTVTSTIRSCDVTIASALPQGWTSGGVQFQWRAESSTTWSNYGSRDTAAPYTRTRNFPLGAYVVRGTWTRSGQSPVLLPETPMAVTAEACPTITVLPPSVDCVGAWRLDALVATLECRPEGQQTLVERFRYDVSVPASGDGTACPAVHGATEERSRDVPCTYVPPPPPPPSPTIYGTVDPDILGTCTAAQHDAHVVPGDDGLLYRTWHPQAEPGCRYAHEHGDNPANVGDPTLAALPVRFGYIVRRTPGHPEEPHEGFKVFTAKPGDVNDEGRVNRVYSRSVFHMGTGGPRRFTQRHHSADIVLRHPEFGLYAHTQLMMDTGGFAGVCDPRAGISKDGLVLGTCIVNSAYEIWVTTQTVRAPGGREVYTAFATPAVFDPITAFDPANPTDVIYAWDARVNPLFRFNDSRSWFRGCERESYAQPGYWSNGGGPTTYWTDAFGQPVAADHPTALRQDISASNRISAPATNDGLNQFKMRRSYCGAGLGLKN